MFVAAPRCSGKSRQTEGIDDILPAMRTDVVLDHGGSGRQYRHRHQFTSIVTAGWYREQSLRSGYIYQMYAYLRSGLAVAIRWQTRQAGLMGAPIR